MDQDTIRVIANIFISFIGAGVLGLPYAFKQAGLLEGKLDLKMAVKIYLNHFFRLHCDVCRGLLQREGHAAAHRLQVQSPVGPGIGFGFAQGDPD